MWKVIALFPPREPPTMQKYVSMKSVHSFLVYILLLIEVTIVISKISVNTTVYF